MNVEVTAKIRTAPHEKLKEAAKVLDSTSKDVIEASVERSFELPLDEQRARVTQVRKRYGHPYPRIGRGNRREKIPA